MFIDLGRRVFLSDEQFKDEMTDRLEEHALTKNDQLVGCPLCLATVATPPPKPMDEAPSATAGAGDDEQQEEEQQPWDR
jgi:hypothetical protein